jgi:perosamine synthetase
VEWDAVLDIAEKHDLKIIDDSCEALGAEYKGRKTGRFGNAAAFAFYPNKQMTTGEGGIIVTDDDEIARLCRSMRNQGRSEMGTWLEHVRLGYNYRMTEMSAALGVSQFQRIESFLAKRAQVAQMYTERLQELEWVRPPVVEPHVRMSWFVYVITLVEGMARDPIMEAMADQGIPTRGYFAPIHTQPYIRERFGDLSDTLPVTESVAQRTIALPFHNNLTEQEIETVVQALKATA